MDFCKKCGTLLIPKKGEKSIVCHNCGTKNKISSEGKIEEIITPKEEVAVIDQNDTNLPITDEFSCDECKNGSAYYWFLQTRAGDEPETKFLKCTKCGYTTRDYG